MGVHKIGDEKSADVRHGEVYRLNSTLRTGLAKLHAVGHSRVSNLGTLSVIEWSELKDRYRDLSTTIYVAGIAEAIPRYETGVFQQPLKPWPSCLWRGLGKVGLSVRWRVGLLWVVGPQRLNPLV